jgi:hypothetical protein
MYLGIIKIIPGKPVETQEAGCSKSKPKNYKESNEEG